MFFFDIGFLYDSCRTYRLVDLMEWTIVFISKTVTNKCSHKNSIYVNVFYT